MNKMSGFLDICIHEVQGAFIPNRQIFDNTLVAYEMLYTLKKKKKGIEKVALALNLT